MTKIKGRVALVTGASSGIGEATAQRLAAAGYKVYGTSRRGAQAGKRSFEMLPLDVTSDESVEAVVREVMRLEGRIDVLVNNAGFGVAPAGAEESSLDQARSIFETNFFGLVRMTRAVVPHMRRARERSHHQHRLRAWLSADAVWCALFRHQARGGRLFGITRPRASHEGHPGLGHRAGVHEDAIRRELHGAGRQGRRVSRGSCRHDQEGGRGHGDCRDRQASWPTPC